MMPANAKYPLGTYSGEDITMKYTLREKSKGFEMGNKILRQICGFDWEGT